MVVFMEIRASNLILSPLLQECIFLFFLMSRTCQMPAANAARDALTQT